jgi:hypothetical protein
MIARHRGDSRVHSRWRPPTPAAPPPPPTATEDDAVFSQQSDDLLSGQGDLDPPRGSHRKPRALIAFATVVAVAVIAGEQHTASGPAVPRLPSTPQQWVSRWTAAELQNPAEVCDPLYAPALSRALKDGPLRPSKPSSSGRGGSGATSPCSSATSAAAGKPSTWYPADRPSRADPPLGRFGRRSRLTASCASGPCGRLSRLRAI